jgi:hypothetical protein
MKYYILYNTTTGEIAQSQSSDNFSIPDGFAVRCTETVFVDARKYRLDIGTDAIVEKLVDANDAMQHRRERVRRWRNWLLTESDWTQTPDNALSDAARAAWRVYRQQLRDFMASVPAEPGADYRPVWPVKPE